MIVVLLSFLLVFIIIYKISRKDFKELGFDGVDWTEVSAVTITIGMFVALIASLVIIATSSTIYNRVSTHEIVATKNDSQVEGNFYFFRGTIDEKNYYFLMENHNGCYEQTKVPCERTVIVETDGTPRIKRKKYYRKCDFQWWVVFSDVKSHGEDDTIFVPKGTIDNNVKWEVF